GSFSGWDMQKSLVTFFLFAAAFCGPACPQGRRGPILLLILLCQRVDPLDLIVRGGAGAHRVGVGGVRAVEVGAAGHDQAVLLAPREARRPIWAEMEGQ